MTTDVFPMGSSDSTEALDPEQFARALDILRSEQHLYTPSRLQRWLFGILTGSIYLLSAICFVLLLAAIAPFVSSKPYVTELTERFGIRGLVTWDHLFVVQFIVLASVLTIAVLIFVLFVLSWPYARLLARERWLARRLGLLSAFSASWAVYRRQRRVRVLLDTLVGLIVPIVTIVVAVRLSYAWFWEDQTNSLPVVVPLAALGVMAMACGAIVGVYFIRRRRERLRLINQLQQSLSEIHQTSRSDPGNVKISKNTYDTIALIERAQISRERVRSILSSAEDPGSFAVQKSRDAQLELSRLDEAVRLRVQDWIDSLMTTPRPGEVRAMDGDEWGAVVPETDVHVVFKVSDREKRIHILSVRPTSGDDASGSAG